jgi:5-methyltetrahydrofolate--homocysteine methyltransferase
MKRAEFRERLSLEVMILDGAMGTLLQDQLPGFSATAEMANVDHPDQIKSIHEAYRDAGAGILTTNTFGANRVKLDAHGLKDRMETLNRQGARIAREAAGERAIVAGCVGPTGKLVEPLGPLSFEEGLDVFREQALILAENEVDLFLMETFSDLKEARIAVIALREVADIPIIALMTFGEDYLTFTGTDPETAVVVLQGLGADVVGVNCSTGPASMLEVVGRMGVAASCPIAVEPNAGMPQVKGSKVSYDVTPDEMAGFAERFVQLGAGIVGTCCGSTPEHTARIRMKLEGTRPVSRLVSGDLRLSSRTRSASIGAGRPFAVIGERINPTNRKDLQEAIRRSDLSLFQEEARRQTREGAHLLDVNAGVPGVDEAVILPRAVDAVENVTDLPLSLDSANPGALEAALRRVSGKPLINSVTGERERMDKILPLAKRYGAGLLCLAVGEEGIPKSAEARLAVLKEIVKSAERAGISRDNLICDCLTLTVSAQQDRAQETLRAVRMVREALNLPTVLGVSNISYGLPDRSVINAAFLSMAMAAGLDAAILNPGDPGIRDTVRAASVLTLRDKDSREFIRSHTRRKKKSAASPGAVSAKPAPLDKIYNAVLAGNRDGVGRLVSSALEAGHTAPDINDHALIPAIEEVGRQYDARSLYLPQMILAAETLQQAFHILEPRFQKGEKVDRGTIILCTVRGDVHDIGKNIVGLFLRNHGFQIVDLGKDVTAEVIVDKAIETSADIVALSALMTTTMMEMPRVIQMIKERDVPVRVMVGGAVVTKRFAREIGADAYAPDGITAVETAMELVSKDSSLSAGGKSSG